MNSVKYRISAASMALILFYPLTNVYSALPLTETVYTIPETQIEFSLDGKLIRIHEYFRKDTYSLGIGILSYLSIWYSFQYLHDGIIKASDNELGDSFLKIWFFAGDYLDNKLQFGILLSLRIPTGRNAYAESKWRNLAFGNNEMKIGPVFKLRIAEHFYSHINSFFVFREAENENFYKGFYINPFQKDTYTNFFGLNFTKETAFFGSNKFKNDYAIFSFAINTDIIYPVIPFMELYFSKRIYSAQKSKNDIEDIEIEGAGINPLFISFGARYFFPNDIYCGIYYIYNPKKEKKFIKDIFGFDFSLQF